MPPPRRRALLAALLALAAALYAASFDIYYVGRLTDDARHIEAAQSLLKGRYPYVNQLPGYPLLLAPAAALGNWVLAKYLNVAFLLGAWLLLLRFFGDAGPEGAWAVTLAALSPLSVLSAATVMTEAPFLFFTAWALVLIKDEARAGPLLAIVLGFCVWIHPQALALLLAAAVVLWERRRPGALGCVAGAAAFAALPFLRNLLAAGTPASYFLESPGRGGALALASVLASNLARWPLLLSQAMFHWTEALPGAGSPAAWVLALAALGLIGLEMSRRRDLVDRLAQVYLVFFVGLHLFWANQLLRYAFPVLPFLFLFLLRPYFRGGGPGAPFAGLLAGLLVFLDLTIAVNAHLPRPGENVPPAAYAWLREHATPSDRVACRRTETLRLLTGRDALRLADSPDPDGWFAALLEAAPAFALDDVPDRDLPPAAPARAEALLRGNGEIRRRLQDGARFAKQFQDSDGLTVYRVLEPPGFREGWALLQEARRLLEAGNLEGALPLYAKAEALHPPLWRLAFEHGTTLMLLGRGAEARPLLEEAVRREPGFLAARANLARVR